ncbi:MAG TPA: 4-demethylwyosine synthase TYW1 [Candidatus Bathyarchaeia archaeon]|nr:MAG: tRNA-modifying enzyme [Candidatus Bathyarchaeota archaeon RBG_16_48_13]HJX23400.1 4-demethylwyosine synthase TYW1 [Candidatus Bathyarchaeia archaeon]
MSILPAELRTTLRSQKYQLVGHHSAVKKCRWLHMKLTENRACYKQKFYGIQTHRCLQMTPTVAHCTMQCQFCWRVQPSDLKISWVETKLPLMDDPETIVDESILAHRKILSGYKSHTNLDMKIYNEALNPKHAAISLDGEPTLYPKLSSLLEIFHKRGFTTFLVTNGTIPKALEKIKAPSQLYVSVYGPDENIFKEVCRPQLPNLWPNLIRTLDLLPSFSCPTVLRLTLVRGLNMRDPKGFANLIKRANPTYVEPKGYVYVGSSRRRLKFENMPTHEEIKDFSKDLANETGYNLIDECRESKVILMSRLEKPIKLTAP